MHFPTKTSNKTCFQKFLLKPHPTYLAIVVVKVSYAGIWMCFIFDGFFQEIANILNAKQYSVMELIVREV